MQTNAGLVQDVQHVDQLRANLGGQADALALTTRQAGGLTVQRQVVQAHLQEEVQAGAYLLQNLGSNLLLLMDQRRLHVVQPLAQLGQVHAGQLRDVLVAYPVGQRLAVQPLTVTLRTGTLGQELVGPLLAAGAVVVLHHRAQVFHHAVEIDEVVAGRVYQLLVDAHALQRTVENLVQRLVGNVLDGRLQVARPCVAFAHLFIFMQNGVNLPENHLVLILAQRHNATLMDAVLAVGNDLVQVYLVDVAQALAPRTSALGRVERERVGRRLTVGKARRGTHELLGEVFHRARLVVHDHDTALALTHGQRHRLAKALVSNH